jgi:hypothetical protein
VSYDLHGGLSGNPGCGLRVMIDCTFVLAHDSNPMSLLIRCLPVRLRGYPISVSVGHGYAFVNVHLTLWTCQYFALRVCE